jgi:hypothetical protein
MQSIKDEEQMEDLVINIILIFDLHMISKSMNNNCRNEGLGCRVLKMICHGHRLNQQKYLPNH